jgi:tRNA(Ile2) C34 agmatinyltransferase TiaS
MSIAIEGQLVSVLVALGDIRALLTEIRDRLPEKTERKVPMTQLCPKCGTGMAAYGTNRFWCSLCKLEFYP